MSVSGCSSGKLDQYKDLTPKASVREFFTGPIKGWGILQDRSGKVTRRFDVDMVGTWKADTGTLQEVFHYYDGEKQNRTWIITALPDGTFEGRAGDILDKATGQESGTAVQWKYRMDLPVGDTTYRLTFDDWMFQMNDGVMINRSYIKKFGITVAELTLFMQKQK